MNKTKQRQSDDLMTVDIERLSAMLSCGHATARKVGNDAGARLIIGRRILYSVQKVKYYIEMLAV